VPFLDIITVVLNTWKTSAMAHSFLRMLVTCFLSASVMVTKVLALKTSALPRLSSRYFDRLKMDPSKLDKEPTLGKLQKLHEAHLKLIPFENLAQHGAFGGPATLDMHQTAEKILNRQRGGFCFELNSLFSCFLIELGYVVTRVPAVVYTPEGFRDSPTHMVLFVAIDSISSKCLYFADVGFGEPAIHALNYSVFDTEQVTPDGMQSLLKREGEDVILYWMKEGKWTPRLKWEHRSSIGDGFDVSSFDQYLQLVQDPTSIFSQKSIVTLMNREYKISMAGNKLKVTGPPRFVAPGIAGSPVIEYCRSEQEVGKILRDRFGIPRQETDGLNLQKSTQASEAIWSDF
jgi:N-hydroxyarylamine O-acetyltransferase